MLIWPALSICCTKSNTSTSAVSSRVPIAGMEIVSLIHRRISLCKCQFDFLRTALPVYLNLDLLSDLQLQHVHGQRCLTARLSDGLCSCRAFRRQRADHPYTG